MSVTPEAVFVPPISLTAAEKEALWFDFLNSSSVWVRRRILKDEMELHDQYMNGRPLIDIWKELAEEFEVSPVPLG
jgi:hypothetical protein